MDHSPKTQHHLKLEIHPISNSFRWRATNPAPHLSRLNWYPVYQEKLQRIIVRGYTRIRLLPFAFWIVWLTYVDPLRGFVF